MIPLAEIVTSFVTTRALSRRGLSRPAFEAMQARALRRWLARDVPRVAAYPDPPGRLADLPITDKATLMAGFERYNRAAITTDEVRTALEGDCLVRGHTVGASSGTSGNRGYFVISEAERFRWLGSLVAKAMADMLWRRQRVAVLLPQPTRLYASARRLPWLKLAVFSLAEGAESWRETLQAFAPTVIVAPPRLLRHLAETGCRIEPKRVFAASETLDPVDRPVIETAFGLRLDQIYMASEGLLGVTCRHGGLHLAEDSVAFEFEPVAGGLVSPLITCFRRQAQILARYRMNDLLRLAPGGCPCGSPLRLVEEVVGRMDDCFRLTGRGGPVLATPDVLRNAVTGADARIDDYRLVQTGPASVDLILPPHCSDETGIAATVAITAALMKMGAEAEIVLHRQALPLDPGRKLRRVECRLPGTGAR